jgi:hypothetical protein
MKTLRDSVDEALSKAARKRMLAALQELQDFQDNKDQTISNLGKGDRKKEISMLLSSVKTSVPGTKDVDFNFYNDADLLYSFLLSPEFKDAIIYISRNSRSDRDSYTPKSNNLSRTISEICTGSGYNEVRVEFSDSKGIVRIYAQGR